jgi:RimJ/RimL family protein N-acetyltransferase
MSELGGPLTRAELHAKLRSIVEEVRGGQTWYSVVVAPGPDGAGAPAGTVCIWDHDWNGDVISEIGWMILPGFQGRGLATAAVRAMIQRAHAEDRCRLLHAFPGVTNGPSNAICRRLGFSNVEELDFGYAGRTLRCNHWVLVLRAPIVRA